MTEVVEILYTNYAGTASWRRIMPRRLWFGSTESHPKEQWLLDAFDCGKGADRTFAMRDVHLWRVPED